MIAEKDNVISIVYELREGSKQGEVVESLTRENPLTFLFGTGGLLPKFEENLNGLASGDSFEFLLNSEDAYGPVIENAVVHVPKSVFEIDGKIDASLMKEGNTVPMMDAEGGGSSVAVGLLEEEAVKMDFNHPMAGSDLHFSGQVTEVRNVTEEELQHGHIHGGDGCGTCNDNGSCDDQSGGGCSCGC